MQTTFYRRRQMLRRALIGAMLAAVAGMPWSDSNAQTGPAYSIDFHLISSSGKRARNSCFILNGTAGQASPGYSSGGFYSILAGFWAVAPTVRDQLFFDGFERCSS